jgi:hypothetical protein
LTRLQYVERYGFGISTTAADGGGPVPDAGPAASGGGATAEASAEAAATSDPNQAIVDALSPDRRQAYEQALNGDGGCQAQAFDTLGSRPENPVVAALRPRFAELYRQVGDDPRVVDATHGYAVCMAKAGYGGIRSPQDAPVKVTVRLGDALGTPEPERAAALAELQRYERQLAARDYRCGLPLERVRLAVQTELEQRFVDDNRPALERYRAVIAATGG